MFRPVDPKPDFPQFERNILTKWYSDGIVSAYLHKNDNSETRFSFMDGPITANNPMGVHHAWGRTYKDLWQKFHNLLGHKQRFQNGFDCQGLWVEVEVEKELELRSKKDIENLVPGDRKASIDKFVTLCKERVKKFAEIQTNQTKRLGNFMDWENSYFTMSDENNYTIWHFLKVCNENGWIYKGKDSVPWCPRCETAISQHEMLTEDYKEVTHESIFVKLPITTKGWENTSLLIWTTTPWSVPSNSGVGVNVKYTYALWKSKKTGEKIIIIAKDQDGNVPNRELKKRLMPINEYVFHGLEDEFELEKEISAQELVGLTYNTPYDSLERVMDAKKECPVTFHTVVDASDIVTAEEGTGLLHIAPSAGGEDFKVGKERNLPIIATISDDASYLGGLGDLTGKNAKSHPEIIIDYLRESGFLLKSLHYTHRYPACWRCKKELVWKVADEWYISMDVKGKVTKRTLREMMQANAKKITWIPDFGLERELDWLKNMHDWLISKKNRYWGLSLPIYECECGDFTILGSKEELKERAVEGWEMFDGHSPHKPWIDDVKIRCSSCNKVASRIEDVGNPWLDAGIVAYSTISENNDGQPLYFNNKSEWEKWFPVDFITESFPGQFKNWFYALIAMSTVMEDQNPFKTVLGFATLHAEDGRPMHKSWGNSIEFNEGADQIGVDVMRWMYIRQNPTENMLFGFKRADDVRRSFILLIWNIYKFFVEYAELDEYTGGGVGTATKPTTDVYLDKWMLARLAELEEIIKTSLLKYDARMSATACEEFVQDLSTWYIRRSRDRVWSNSQNKEDKQSFYSTLHFVLVNFAIMLSPSIPFITDEIYTNLTSEKSVHLANWPDLSEYKSDETIKDMKLVREMVEVGHRIRKEQRLKVRQPLASVTFIVPKEMRFSNDTIKSIISAELNVKGINIESPDTHSEAGQEISAKYDIILTDELKKEGEVRELIRSIQELRKKEGLQQKDMIELTLPEYPQEFGEEIKTKVSAQSIILGESISIKKVS